MNALGYLWELIFTLTKFMSGLQYTKNSVKNGIYTFNYRNMNTRYFFFQMQKMLQQKKSLLLMIERYKHRCTFLAWACQNNQ